MSESNRTRTLKIEVKDKTFFEDWSKDYDERRNKSFLEKSKKNMLSLVEQFKNDIHSCYLEIGLGTGEGFEMTSTQFQFSYGTDISEGMVRQSSLKGERIKNLFVADACSLPLRKNSFDFIICQDVLEHVPDQSKLVFEISRILRGDGVAIITTPNPLWSPILYIAEKLRLKVEEGDHKFVFLKGLVKKCLKNEYGHESISTDKAFMMLPIISKLDKVVERFVNKSPVSSLGFSQMCIIKKPNKISD
ncbi:MAG: class I SAM-dependent methyltransferase [Candidatus Nitrosopolaris sp.]